MVGSDSGAFWQGRVGQGMARFSKPTKVRRERRRLKRVALKRSTKPMNKIGVVRRRRRKVSRELTAEAKRNGHDYCELAPVLRDFGIDNSSCFFGLENCHSVKCSERGSDPVLDRETARGCGWHHKDVLDHQTHEVQARVVREAIARREMR